MRNRLLVQTLTVIAVLALVVLAGACQPKAAPTKAAVPIKFGFNMELTGASAVTGDRALKGAQLAVEQINAKGGVLGRPIELVVEDNASTPPGSVTAMNKLLSDKDIVAMIGPIRSSQIQADSDIVKAAKVPWPISGTAPVLTTLGNEYLWRMRTPDTLVAEGAVRFALENLKATKIGLMNDTQAFGAGGAAQVIESLKTRNLAPVDHETFSVGDKDYTAQLLNLQKSGADVVIFWCANAEDDAVILRQINELGCTFKIIGSTSWASTDLLKLAGDKAEGIYGVNDFVAESNPVAKDFGAAWRAKYQDAPDLFSVMQADQVFLVAEAIRLAGSTDPVAINNAFPKIQNFQTNLGKVSFDAATHEGCKWLYITQIQGGKPALLTTVTW